MFLPLWHHEAGEGPLKAFQELRKVVGWIDGVLSDQRVDGCLWTAGGLTFEFVGNLTITYGIIFRSTNYLHLFALLLVNTHGQTWSSGSQRSQSYTRFKALDVEMEVDCRMAITSITKIHVVSPWYGEQQTSNMIHIHSHDHSLAFSRLCDSWGALDPQPDSSQVAVPMWCLPCWCMMRTE